MKKLEIITSKISKSLAEKALRTNANSTSCGIFFQPVAPAKLTRFKARKK